MSITVSNLTVQQYLGQETYHAFWSFDGNTKSGASGAVTVGSYAVIADGGKTINGTAIDSTKTSSGGKKWKVASVKGSGNDMYAYLTVSQNYSSTSSGISGGIQTDISNTVTGWDSTTGGTILSNLIGSGTQLATDIQSELSGSTSATDSEASETLYVNVPLKYLTVNGVPGMIPTTTLKEFKVVVYHIDSEHIYHEIMNTTTAADNMSIDLPAFPAYFKIMQIKVKPVSTSYQSSNGETVDWWTGEYSVVEISAANGRPASLAAGPTCSVSNNKLTASYTNITDPRTDKILFELYANNVLARYAYIDVINNSAIWETEITYNSSYKIRAVGVNVITEKNWAGSPQWSPYVTITNYPPGSLPDKPNIYATSMTSAHVHFTKAPNATGYVIQAATTSRLFDYANSDQVTTVTISSEDIDPSLNYVDADISGLTSGSIYCIRIKATNDYGYSPWTDIQNITLGAAPSAPTTWVTSSCIAYGTNPVIYYVHNTIDGSSATKAKIAISINGGAETEYEQTISGQTSTVYSYTYTVPSSLSSGGTIQWRVKTAGYTNVYGDWSAKKNITIAAPPTISVVLKNSAGSITSIFSSLPINVNLLFASSATQHPLGYTVKIKSQTPYDINDKYGRSRHVKVGDVVYSKYITMSGTASDYNYSYNIGAGDVELSSGASYLISALVESNNGTTASYSTGFAVNWAASSFNPESEIGVNPTDYSITLRPYCIDSNGNRIANTTLSVYRKNYDGTFTTISEGLNNQVGTMIVDPHPPLDYASYRLVATNSSTGLTSSSDINNYPVGGKNIILQWDEEYTTTDEYMGNTRLVNGLRTGNIIQLPFNIDVSESTSKDVEMIKYIGRSDPVSYYGTHLSVSTTWNTDILKSDTETIYKLRRLAKYMGNVYVREPSGVGYWANVEISFSNKHKNLTIPVSIKITKVDGGL